MIPPVRPLVNWGHSPQTPSPDGRILDFLLRVLTESEQFLLRSFLTGAAPIKQTSLIPIRPPLGKLGAQPPDPQPRRENLGLPSSSLTESEQFLLRSFLTGAAPIKQTSLIPTRPPLGKLGAQPPDPQPRRENLGLPSSSLTESEQFLLRSFLTGAAPIKQTSLIPPARPLVTGGTAPRPPAQKGGSPGFPLRVLTESEQFLLRSFLTGAAPIKQA